MEKKRMIQIVRSVKGTLMAHPDNQENSEFADRISSLEELEQGLGVSGLSDLLLLFDQMIKEENEALGKAGFYNQYGRETHANNKYCLAIVKSLIEKRFSNSG